MSIPFVLDTKTHHKNWINQKLIHRKVSSEVNWESSPLN